jgi:hypothetical protein
MIIISFYLNPLGFKASFLLTTASITIKVVYDHTRIASYRHWSLKSAGQLRFRLLVLNGRSAKLAGGFAKWPHSVRTEPNSKFGIFRICDLRTKSFQ